MLLGVLCLSLSQWLHRGKISALPFCPDADIRSTCHETRDDISINLNVCIPCTMSVWLQRPFERRRRKKKRKKRCLMQCGSQSVG